ncbi:MAG: hypothetical protein JEZ12_24190 [Desulfobacterium sp.]|nr:hypothetical protein [Desulfobacterium sp.]
MPLINFGSILGFAEGMEKQNLDFFLSAANTPGCAAYQSLFDGLIKNSRKHIKDIQRTRRENVTEMILESIEGFFREPFVLETKHAPGMDVDGIFKTAGTLIERSIRYYGEAAVKLKGQSEVSGTLKNLGKKYKRDLDKLVK